MQARKRRRLALMPRRLIHRRKHCRHADLGAAGRTQPVVDAAAAFDCKAPAEFVAPRSAAAPHHAAPGQRRAADHRRHRLVFDRRRRRQFAGRKLSEPACRRTANAFPGREITVLNRGVNGEETEHMMARFADDVIAAHPHLVLWQVGTNSVLRDHPLKPHAVQLHDGIEQLKDAGADVVLIDPQFAPAVLAKSETPGMDDADRARRKGRKTSTCSTGSR